MKMTKTIKAGKRNYTFQFEGNDLHEVVTASKYIGFEQVPKCGICGSDNLILDAHEAQGYKYTTIRCMKCRATLTLGERKDKSAVFLRKNDTGNYDWRAYSPPATAPNSPVVARTQNTTPAYLRKENATSAQNPQGKQGMSDIDNKELPF